MSTKHPIYPTICLMLLLCSLLFAYTNVANAQKVHACLILLQNDRDATFRASVSKNEFAMIDLMELVSRNADVHRTLMKSEPGGGEVRHTHLVNTETKDEDSPKQLGIIKPAQVTEWIRNLKVGPSDTVLVYFNGHGKVDKYGTHQLLFDKTKRLARDVILKALQEKPCRLKLLITDTCSQVTPDTRPAGGHDLAKFGDLEAKPQFYARNLFLEHTGTLDITATSPEIRTASDTDLAYGDDQVGGFFTYALTSTMVPAADTNGDDFLSWEEAFAATQAGTKQLCEAQPLLKAQNKIQQPVAHELPMRAELAPDSLADMVLIPAGEFRMGSNDDGNTKEKPVHTVYVDAFYMDKYEVTNAEFKTFVDANPEWRKDRIEDGFHDGGYLKLWRGNNYPSGRADHPVVNVSWYAAMAYSEWAGKRLPTEAEWEKAARGGLEGQKYPSGNTIDRNQANYGGGDTAPVGQYAENGYGLHDMAGNVWEWCLDKYDADFSSGPPRRNPVNGDSIQSIINNYRNNKSHRVLRGGSWGDNAAVVRVAYRDFYAPTLTDDYSGFRCVRAVSP